MTRKMITSPPEVGDEDIKRWFIGDLEDGSQKAFVFERPRSPDAEPGQPRYMLRLFTPEGDVIQSMYFQRRHTLSKRLCRLFDVDIIELSEKESLSQAA